MVFRVQSATGGLASTGLLPHLRRVAAAASLAMAGALLCQGGAGAQEPRAWSFDDGLSELADQISDRFVTLHDGLTEPMTFYVLPARSAEGLTCEPLTGQLTDSLNKKLANEVRDLGRRNIQFQMMQGNRDDSAISLEWRRVSDRLLRLESRIGVFATTSVAGVAEVHIDVAQIPEEPRLCVETEYVYAECVADRSVRLRNSPRRGRSVGTIEPGEEFEVLGAYDIGPDDRAGALLIAWRPLNDTGNAREERQAFALGGTDQLIAWRDSGVCDLVDLGRFQPRAAEAPWRPRDTIVDDCPDCPRLAVLPEGRFALGNGSGPSGLAGQGVSFEVGRMLGVAETETTVAQWEACARAGGCDPLARTAAPARRGEEPVSVSHEQALQYVAWLNAATGRGTYRLPTEAEWEYAARTDRGGRYAWGDVMLRDAAVCRECGTGGSAPDGPAPVRSRSANDWGLHDMSGNLWEWVSDCWLDGAAAPAGADGACASGERVVKGGSFADDPLALRIDHRGHARESLPHPRIGFRVVATGPAPR